MGEGAGEGFTVNVPWPCGGMRDMDYLAAFNHVVMPIAYGAPVQRRLQPRCHAAECSLRAALFGVEGHQSRTWACPPSSLLLQSLRRSW